MPKRIWIWCIFSILAVAIIGCESTQSTHQPSRSPVEEAKSDRMETHSHDQLHADMPDSRTAPPSSTIDFTQYENTQPAENKAEFSSGEGITVIGDSVMVGVSPFLEEMLPGIVVDGKVSRQMRDAREVIDELQAQGRLGDRIIIELGTNGPFNPDQLRSLLDSLGDKKVFMVNTRVPKEWQDPVNRIISEVAEEYDNTIVIDWYSASEDKDDYFSRDGVHLTEKGAKSYASMLREALEANES